MLTHYMDVLIIMSLSITSPAQWIVILTIFEAVMRQTSRMQRYAKSVTWSRRSSKKTWTPWQPAHEASLNQSWNHPRRRSYFNWLKSSMRTQARRRSITPALSNTRWQAWRYRSRRLRARQRPSMYLPWSESGEVERGLGGSSYVGRMKGVWYICYFESSRFWWNIYDMKFTHELAHSLKFAYEGAQSEDTDFW